MLQAKIQDMRWDRLSCSEILAVMESAYEALSKRDWDGCNLQLDEALSNLEGALDDTGAEVRIYFSDRAANRRESQRIRTFEDWCA